MTNQELLKAIEQNRKEQKGESEKIQDELKELKKEFYLFKGKAFGFISVLTTGITFLVDFLKHK
jgi:hypothetical protein